MPTKTYRFLSLLLVFLLMLPFPAGAEPVDYAARPRLSGGSVLETSVVCYVDGDTTHFAVPEDIAPGGVLKARYLGVNTPECTGMVEPYGKKAAAFTRDKLSGAQSILIESEDEDWHLDSTGGRYLTWVWYRPEGEAGYRCLNVELLQNGLAVPTAVTDSRYRDTCVSALNQAKAQGLNLYSGEPDPDFYYGDAIELTIRELREHPEEYADRKVAFNGIITMNYGGSVTLEQYDPETCLYYGMPVYYGYNLNGQGLRILAVGNESRIVGTFQYYQNGSIWQVTDVSYRMMKPEDPGNLQLLSQGHAPAYAPITAAELAGQRGFTAQATSARMTGLQVLSAAATQSEDSTLNGSLTLTCMQDGVPVRVYTAPLYDETGGLIPPETYLDQTITVQGIVDTYEGQCQLHVFRAEGITLQP